VLDVMHFCFLESSHSFIYVVAHVYGAFNLMYGIGSTGMSLPFIMNFLIHLHLVGPIIGGQVRL